jgi:hypothetical protein
VLPDPHGRLRVQDVEALYRSLHCRLSDAVERGGCAAEKIQSIDHHRFPAATFACYAVEPTAELDASRGNNGKICDPELLKAGGMVRVSRY